MNHAPRIHLNPYAAPGERRHDLARLFRIGVCAGLVLAWLIMLLLAWGAFSTLPSAERLEESRMTQIPTLLTFRNLALRSSAELAALIVLLWPAARLYLTRVALTLLALIAWFLATVPLTVTTMSWVHRRWLAALVAALFALLVAGVTARVIRRTVSSAPQ